MLTTIVREARKLLLQSLGEVVIFNHAIERDLRGEDLVKVAVALRQNHVQRVAVSRQLGLTWYRER